MNPLKFFDYVYFTISSFYSRRYNLGHSNELAGILFLSVLQVFNGVIILAILRLPDLNKDLWTIVIVGYMIILSLNFLRYKKYISSKKLDEIWKLKNNTNKLVLRILIAIYILATFFLMIYIPGKSGI